MDVLADELGMDPVEVRRKNFIPPDAFPYKTPTGPTYDSGDYEKPLTKALEMAGLRRRCAPSRRGCASRAATSASASPPSPRSAASGPSTAPRCASSRAAR